MGQNLGSVVGFSTNYLNKSCNFGTVFYDSVSYLSYVPFSALSFFYVDGKLFMVDLVCYLVFIQCLIK